MSRPHLPSYVRAVLACLQRIRARVVEEDFSGGGRFVIVWRLGRKQHKITLARHTSDPHGYGDRMVARIRALAGLQGAVA